MLSVAMVAVAPLGGRLADRRGHRLPAVAGWRCWPPPPPPWPRWADAPSAAGLAAALLVAGVGLGLANAPLQAAAVEAVDPRDAGIASGLFSSGRYTGSILSSALLAVLLGHGTRPRRGAVRRHGRDGAGRGGARPAAGRCARAARTPAIGPARALGTRSAVSHGWARSPGAASPSGVDELHHVGLRPVDQHLAREVGRPGEVHVGQVLADEVRGQVVGAHRRVAVW